MELLMIEIVYTGVKRGIKTSVGRFKRGNAKRVTVSDAKHLMDNYEGFTCHALPGKLKAAAMVGSRLAIMRNGGLGDVIAVAYFLALPLKKAHKDNYVAFGCLPQYADVMKRVPFLDEVNAMPFSLQGFEASLDMSWVVEKDDPTSKKVRPELFAMPADDLADFKFPYLRMFDDDIKWGYEEFVKLGKEFTENPPNPLLQIENRKQIGAPRIPRQAYESESSMVKGEATEYRPLVGIQTTSASPIRVYAPEYLTELIRLLIEAGYDVAIFGQDTWHWGMKQWKGDHLYNFIDKTTLLECASLMAFCDYVIAPDSGLMHLASVMGIPTFALFGNILPENRIKYYPRTRALYPEGELNCIPCGDVHNPCPECSGLGKGNKRFSGMCMRLLKPPRVMKAFESFVEKFGEALPPLIPSQEGDEKANTPIPLLPMRDKREFDQKCPFCGSAGEVVNRIQGKWFNETYPDPVVFYRCVSCKSIYSDPSQKISYEAEYWTVGGQFAGDYFERKNYHQRVYERVMGYIGEN